jgi:hypothetical protein
MDSKIYNFVVAILHWKFLLKNKDLKIKTHIGGIYRLLVTGYTSLSCTFQEKEGYCTWESLF